MATSKAYDELVDLFARGTTPEGVLSFAPSAQSIARARYLIARQKSGDITPDEAAELEQLGAIEHLMQLVKARARRYLSA
jgi:hypothetical protein